ncbi:MAG: hypothetical protein EXQ70_10295 [Solirubrobacterales bacterium]|nr:hypothetical protein [Solirubrobacterales bacterium]
MHRRTPLASVALALTAALTCSGVATAAGGGVGTGGGDGANDSAYRNVGFGARTLGIGMRGDDVKTLNWILKSQPFGGKVPYKGNFVSSTKGAVQKLQSGAGIPTNGIVGKKTRKVIAGEMTSGNATWYGPGFYGNRTACGLTLSKKTIGVANKKLPCGTAVTFAYRGHWVRAKVIDRGPYNAGYSWDLTSRLAKQLGFLNTGAGVVKAAVVR